MIIGQDVTVTIGLISLKGHIVKIYVDAIEVKMHQQNIIIDKRRITEE